ncbi:MAG TPA: hypothetical protein VH209_09785 [Steroidobacteraceae bacterium]|nr:hypothetical protein [Steroidobacteraceae bacterium]
MLAFGPFDNDAIDDDAAQVSETLMVGTLLVGRSDTSIMAVMLRRASLALRSARSNGMPFATRQRADVQ